MAAHERPSNPSWPCVSRFAAAAQTGANVNVAQELDRALKASPELAKDDGIMRLQVRLKEPR